MVCRNELVRQHLRRIGRRRVPGRNFRLAPEGFDVQVADAQGTVVLREDLVALGLFLQVVELGELEVALPVGRVGDTADIRTAPVDCRAGNRAGATERDIAARVGQRGEAGYRVFRDVRNRPVFFAEQHFRLVLVPGRRDPVPVTALDAVGDRHIIVAVVIAIPCGIGPADFETFQVVAGDEVHNAGNGVRTIQRRGAVFQHFDPADGGLRNHVGVDEELRLLAHGERRIGLAVTVDQHQRTGGAEAAQVDVRRAFEAVRRELVGLAVHTGRRAEVADHFRQARIAFQLEVLCTQNIHRQRGIFRCALNERTCDRDRTELALAVIGFLCMSNKAAAQRNG